MSFFLLLGKHGLQTKVWSSARLDICCSGDSVINALTFWIQYGVESKMYKMYGYSRRSAWLDGEVPV